MIITTPKGNSFDTEKPAKSNLAMILNNKGNQELDVLKITGNMTIVEQFREEMAMIEVDTSFGITEISEDYVWQ